MGLQMIPSTNARVLDAAASVFARHGFAQASVQSLADAAGYSKAGLLHHYSTKVILYGAVLTECRAQTERVRDQLADLPVGPVRDRRAIELLVDLALARPGLASLLLSTIAPSGENGPLELDDLGDNLLETLEPESANDLRRLRVTGAIVMLGVLAMDALRADRASAWRNEIIAASFDALGHRVA